MPNTLNILKFITFLITSIQFDYRYFFIFIKNFVYRKQLIWFPSAMIFLQLAAISFVFFRNNNIITSLIFILQNFYSLIRLSDIICFFLLFFNFIYFISTYLFIIHTASTRGRVVLNQLRWHLWTVVNRSGSFFRSVRYANKWRLRVFAASQQPVQSPELYFSSKFRIFRMWRMNGISQCYKSHTSRWMSSILFFIVDLVDNYFLFDQFRYKYNFCLNNIINFLIQLYLTHYTAATAKYDCCSNINRSFVLLVVFRIN